MARFQGDELVGDDIDAVLQAIDEDFFNQDPDLTAEVDRDISEIPIEAVRKSFTCSFCTKVCLSQRGLSRHVNVKHKDQQQQTSAPAALSAEERLHPLVFKKFLQASVDKLAVDECYPENIMDEFKAFSFSNLDDVFPSYSLVKDIIYSFAGDAEKFYPAFYKVFSDAENPFAGLSRHSSLLLGFEVANHVLAHLTGSNFQDDILSFKQEQTVFSEKEKAIITYLSGYVISTFYRRIRFSKKEGAYHDQCLSFLLACKSSGNETDVSSQKLVNLKDRGGLWKVNGDTIAIFSVAESYFVTATKQFTTKIDCKGIVSNLIKDPWLLVNFSKIRNSSSEKVKKEVVINLLEDLLTLYIRVRSPSFAKNQQQLHKIQAAKSKTRSLRTEIKQKSEISFVRPWSLILLFLKTAIFIATHL